jgi:hypothetical protein
VLGTSGSRTAVRPFRGSDWPPLRLPGGPSRAAHPRGCRARLCGVAQTFRGSGAGGSVGTGSTHPASRFGGNPAFPRTPRTSNRRCPSRLSSSCTPLAGAGGSALTRRAHQLSPPGLWSSTALPARRIRSKTASSVAARFRPSRGTQPRQLPPSAFLGCSSITRTLRRPRRFTPRRTSRAASRRPGTLLRFRLQGLYPPRGAAPVSGPLLSCRSLGQRRR